MELDKGMTKPVQPFPPIRLPRSLRLVLAHPGTLS
jgi:hypothetical protein